MASGTCDEAVTRRRAVQLGAAAGIGLTLGTSAFAAAGSPGSVAQWDFHEIVLKGPSDGNPFRDVQLTATFTQDARKVTVTGFYDGAGTYKIRFMPDTVGEWRYTTQSNAPRLNGQTGGFRCTAARAGVHGPVRVRNIHHFGYADDTPFYPFGTTSYAWIHQTQSLQEQTLATLAKAPFNKIRMCVFPKSYEYNHNEPPFYPFVRDAAGKSDFTRPDPAFFAHLERRLLDLQKLGIEADLILFHPYDRWGYSTMSAEDDDAYLRYVLARVGSFRHIWWSLANEYDFMKAKTAADFDRFFHIVEREDPYGHLRSIHQGHVPYDYSHPWVTHVSIQGNQYLAKTAELIREYGKPVVHDEVQYEGNLNRRWGNLAGDEMTWRFWRGVIGGGYVTHGETLLDADEQMNEEATPAIWWSTGGVLKGTSPARIAFLRKIVEETAGLGGNALAGFEADPKGYYANVRAMSPDRKVMAILYFMDDHAPIWNEFPLPRDSAYRAELIDPWAMTVTPVDGKFSGKTKMRLTGKPYQAVRFRRI